MNLIAHALGAYYGQSARRISAPSGRACKFHEQHAVHLLLFPFRCRVISICGCVTLACGGGECKTPNKGRGAGKKQRRRAYVLAVDIARGVFYFAQSSDAVNGRRRMHV